MFAFEGSSTSDRINNKAIPASLDGEHSVMELLARSVYLIPL